MILFFIIVSGLILRLISINQSLWLDEGISALAARDFSYSRIIFDFLKIDNHPPIFYLILKFWSEIFGFTDVSLRLLSVLIGTLIIFFVYKITEIISENKKTSLIAALLTASSPLLVYFSQEIRMYILITLLSSIQIFIFLRILKKEELIDWMGFSILSCLLFFSDYVTVFFFPVFFIYAVIKRQHRLFQKTFLSFIPLFILFAFWLPEFQEQLKNNANLVSAFPGWGSLIGGATLKNLILLWMKFINGRISFDPKILYYLLVFISSIPVLFCLFISFKKRKANLVIWLWLIFPVILGFIFSFLIPAFNYFRFIYVLPAFLIIIVFGLSEIKNNLFRNFLLGFILVSNITSLGIYYLDPSQQRENWKQAVLFIEQNAKSDDIVIFEFKEPFAPYRFYEKGIVKNIGGTDSYFADKTKTEEKVRSAISGKNGVYLFEYLRDLSDPNKIIEGELINQKFVKKDIYNDFKNIGQLSYWVRQ